MFQIIKTHKKVVVHILIWLSFLTLVLLQSYQLNTEISERILLGTVLNIFIFYINYSFLVPKFLLKKRAPLYFAFVVILMLITVLIIKTVLPIENFQIPTREGGTFGPLKSLFPIIFSSAFIITGTALRMYEEWILNVQNKKEIEAKQNVTKLESLKNQLNPHFLFNSLNSIYSLANKKSNEAPEAIITLSELMRYMLYRTNEKLVPLQQELNYIENYIKLQRLRIANDANVKINIRGNVNTQQISPLLFISFIENAFKYGTDFKGNMEVKIVISVNENELHFECSNIIGSKNSSQEDSGIGLSNTKKRLNLLYPQRHTLIIKEENNRFIVDLKLKLD